MASRSSRSAARASPAPGVKPRAPSPLSPTKISRTEEKRTLGNLNDRLAAYIERVRTLELENNRLEQQVTTIEETNSKEIISVRHMYDKELNQARKALDETAKEKAKWEIEAERHKSSNRDIQARFNERQSELDRLDRANKSLENQLADVKKKNDDLCNDRNRLSEEIRSIKPDYDRMKNKLLFFRRLQELREQLDDQARIHRADMAKKDHKIEQLTALTKEYEELLEIKKRRKLLEGEELRLGLSQSQDPDTTDSGTRGERGTKRKRLMESEEYSGVNVTTTYTQPGVFLIEPLEENNKCIKVRNTGETEESLGGFSLKSTSEGLETIYKFHRTVKCAPGAVVTVWSSDSGEEHSPSDGQLVMKEGAWKFGDLVETVLVDKEGDVVASRDTKKEVDSYGTQRRFAGRRAGLKADGDDKNCSIM